MMQPGDACFFRRRVAIHRHGGPWTPWVRGTYRYSYMYDGIIAKVYEDDPDDLIERSLFLALGDMLVWPEDMKDLAQWEDRWR